PNAGITIFVAPLISLMDDMAHRAAHEGIPHLHFSEAIIYEYDKLLDGTLIIASQDIICGEGFRRLVRRLVADSRLDWVVVDEAHMSVTEQGYRDILARGANWISSLDTQILFLSGTMPPFLLPEVAKLFGFMLND